MFGLDNRTLLKKDIIEILDHSGQGLSVEEIQKKLGYSNLVTILATCKEIMTIAQKVYVNADYSLQIENSNRGLFELKRYSTNLQSLYKEIFSKDIAYDILMALIQQRSLSSEKLCQTYNISRSTLQRKIKAINREIESFQVYITCSEKVRFKADELHIRSFSYVFFWSIHRELENDFWLKKGSHYLFIAEQVLRYLGCPFDPIKNRSLALWLQLFSIGIAKKQKLTFSSEQNQFLAHCVIPPCPDFLPGWNDLEWRTLIGVLFASNIYKYDLQFDFNDLNGLLSTGDLTYELFESSVKTYFGPIAEKNKHNVLKEIARYQLLNMFINPQSKKSLQTIMNHVLSFDFLKEEQPYYWKKYAYSWINLKKALRKDEQHSYMRYLCLTLCLEAFPIENFLPEVNVYLTSDIDAAYENYLKQAISLHFRGKVAFLFTDTLKEADIILSTLPFPAKYLRKNQQSLVIRAHLYDKDLLAMDRIINQQMTKN